VAPGGGGVKRGRGVNHPPLSSTEVKERVNHTSTPRLGVYDLLLGRTLPFWMALERKYYTKLTALSPLAIFSCGSQCVVCRSLRREWFK
jgi:hypothetical protein